MKESTGVHYPLLRNPFIWRSPLEESEEKSSKTKWKQRDLEDQIKEEIMEKEEIKKIKPSEVLNLLKQGYTRLKKDDKGQGSIQEKYGLTGYQVIQLFKDRRLKGRKTIFQKSPGFILSEEEETSVEKRLEDEPEEGGLKDRGEIEDVPTISEKDEIFL